MDNRFPTQLEIDAHIRDGERLRAETIAAWVKAGVAWLAHPRFGHRPA